MQRQRVLCGGDDFTLRAAEWAGVGQTGRQGSLKGCGCVGTQDKGQQTVLVCVERWRIGWRLSLLLLVVERSVEGGGHGGCVEWWHTARTRPLVVVVAHPHTLFIINKATTTLVKLVHNPLTQLLSLLFFNQLPTHKFLKSLLDINIKKIKINFIVLFYLFILLF